MAALYNRLAEDCNKDSLGQYIFEFSMMPRASRSLTIYLRLAASASASLTPALASCSRTTGSALF